MGRRWLIIVNNYAGLEKRGAGGLNAEKYLKDTEARLSPGSKPK